MVTAKGADLACCKGLCPYSITHNVSNMYHDSHKRIREAITRPALNSKSSCRELDLWFLCSLYRSVHSSKPSELHISIVHTILLLFMFLYKLSGIVKAEWDYGGEAGIFSFVINSLCLVEVGDSYTTFSDYEVVMKMKLSYVHAVYPDKQMHTQ